MFAARSLFKLKNIKLPNRTFCTKPTTPNQPEILGKQNNEKQKMIITDVLFFGTLSFASLLYYCYCRNKMFIERDITIAKIMAENGGTFKTS